MPRELADSVPGRCTRASGRASLVRPVPSRRIFREVRRPRKRCRPERCRGGDSDAGHADFLTAVADPQRESGSGRATRPDLRKVMNLESGREQRWTCPLSIEQAEGRIVVAGKAGKGAGPGRNEMLHPSLRGSAPVLRRFWECQEAGGHSLPAQPEHASRAVTAPFPGGA